uniref:Putative la-related protein 6B n=1 Tax=Davidia involucrata TaxID=16924 RepID=A0A5B6ZFZ1_DAVIN
MAQDSDSLSETLDSSLSVNDRITNDDYQSSSTATSSSSDPSLSRNVSFSRLNAQAPEFVPRSSSSSSTTPQPRLVIPQPPPPGLVHVYPPHNSPFHVPIQSHMAVPTHVSVQNHHPHPHHVPVQYQHHHRQYYGGVGFGDHQEVAVPSQQQAPVELDHASGSRNGLSEESTQKILNQVEYYFSDVNLATTDHLMRFINKDSEGYVPISVVASFKKIKALISSNSQLATILRNSAKLMVSEDGKKVRRQHPLTQSDMEELQSRIVVAENLPEDHCHQNLMKIFSAIGSVKTIRTCQPQASNGGASLASRLAKADSTLYSNKLHAFVEYESIELAEKAVAELNDEGNWRSSLRVRLFLRRTAKSAQARTKKAGHEGEGREANYEEDDTSTSEPQQPSDKNLDDFSQQSDAQSHDYAGEDYVNEEGGQRKGRGRGRGKGRGRAQYHHNNRGCHVGTPPSNNSVNVEQQIVAKQPPGPRMPDGTRGFSMGRGKPVAVIIA